MACLYPRLLIPDDGMIRCLKQAIQAYRIQSFAAFCIEVTVTPDFESEKIDNGYGKFVRHSRYVFTQSKAYASAVRKSMMARLNVLGRVDVLFLSRWCDIAFWLATLTPHLNWHKLRGTENYCVLTWRYQSQWWKANGMSFRFFDLPREIRDLVYDLLLQAVQFTASSSLSAFPQCMSPGMLRANRELREEVLHAASVKRRRLNKIHEGQANRLGERGASISNRGASKSRR